MRVATRRDVRSGGANEHGENCPNDNVNNLSDNAAEGTEEDEMICQFLLLILASLIGDESNCL